MHADIKTSNVLVYAAQDFYSENWRIKLSDFGNSVPNVDEWLEAGSRSIHGTPLYQAPELDFRGREPSPVEIPAAIDIWSWGMLLWAVINDGEAYKNRDDTAISPANMQRLRERGELASLAYDTCLSKIRSRHSQEHGNIRRILLETVQHCLSADPSARPSASNLLARLQRSLPDEK